MAFVAQAALASLISPIAPADLAAEPARQGTAFYDIVRASIGGWLATVVALTKAIGPAFAAMTAQAAAARLLYGMARDGRLPGRPRPGGAARGVPATALATTGALTLAVAVWAARRADGLTCSSRSSMSARWPPSPCSTPRSSATSSSAGTTSGGCGTCIVPLIGALVTLWVLVEASVLAQTIGVVWAVLGAVVWWLRRPGVRLASASAR